MAKIAHFPKQKSPLKPRINSDCMHQKTNIVFSLTQDKIYQKSLAFLRKYDIIRGELRKTNNRGIQKQEEGNV